MPVLSLWLNHIYKDFDLPLSYNPLSLAKLSL